MQLEMSILIEWIKNSQSTTGTSQVIKRFTDNRSCLTFTATRGLLDPNRFKNVSPCFIIAI